MRVIVDGSTAAVALLLASVGLVCAACGDDDGGGVTLACDYDMGALHVCNEFRNAAAQGGSGGCGTMGPASGQVVDRCPEGYSVRCEQRSGGSTYTSYAYGLTDEQAETACAQIAGPGDQGSDGGASVPAPQEPDSNLEVCAFEADLSDINDYAARARVADNACTFSVRDMATDEVLLEAECEGLQAIPDSGIIMVGPGLNLSFDPPDMLAETEFSFEHGEPSNSEEVGEVAILIQGDMLPSGFCNNTQDEAFGTVDFLLEEAEPACRAIGGLELWRVRGSVHAECGQLSTPVVIDVAF